MPEVTKTLGNNKARACESLGFAHKKEEVPHFDTPSFPLIMYCLFYEVNIAIIRIHTL